MSIIGSQSKPVQVEYIDSILIHNSQAIYKHHKANRIPIPHIIIFKTYLYIEIYNKTMILSKPWDHIHQIDNLQQQQEQQQRRNNKITKQQYQSSVNLTVTDDTVEIDSQSQTRYAASIQSHDEEGISSQEEDDDEMHGNNSMGMKNVVQLPYSQQYQQPAPNNDNTQFISNRQGTTRKKYGNLIVFFQTSSTFFSLGPNYLFFIFAYFCFTIASIYLVKLVNLSIQSDVFGVVNCCVCMLQNGAYLLVAFSNPGVELAQTQTLMTSGQIKNNRLCKKCGAVQQRKTYHCRQCDICIKDYDHHCPWTSKCIGGGNLKRFYLFVAITPFYIFYYIITFMICMGNLAIQQNANLKNQSQLTKL